MIKKQKQKQHTKQQQKHPFNPIAMHTFIHKQSALLYKQGHFMPTQPDVHQFGLQRYNPICDMIKGNVSLVENFNSYFLAPL